MVGEQLGHYRIVEKIGAGGMGEVYLATDLVLGRRAAIKVLHPQMLRDQVARDRFLLEARTVASLNHPGIAVLYEAGELAGVAYLAFEYVEGHTLDEEISRGPLPLRRILNCSGQILSALQHAHKRNILHRDIKASNIAVTAEGDAKLLDFGLAKVIATGDQSATQGALTEPGSWVGTLQYAAPEILTGHAAGVAGDLYSYGVVLYQAACGELPFSGLQGPALVSAILHGQVPPIQKRNPALPGELVRIIERAMALRAADRFASAQDFATAMREVSGEARPAAEAPVVSGPSVAVLEFRNISGDSSTEWLGTGIAETLTSDLKKLKLLRIVSRERVQQAVHSMDPAKKSDAAAIGAAANSRWVVTGSYQRAGNRVRITPTLIEAATGEIISTSKVDGDWDDIFALQDRVVSELMKALEVHVDSSALQRIAAPETLRLEAYEQYSEARKALASMGKTTLETARHKLERAINLDSHYAAAYSALGFVHCMRYIHSTDPDDLTRGIAYAERALQLDPELGEPYPYLCYAYSRQGKIEQAIAAGKRGVERQPDLVQAHYFCGVPYMLTVERPRHYQHAADHFLRAKEIDPLFHASSLNLGWIALMIGDYTQADQFLEYALDLERKSGTLTNQFTGSALLLGAVAWRRGQLQIARERWTQSLETLAGIDHVYRDAFMACTACMMGKLHLGGNDAEAALQSFRHAWRIAKEYPRMLGNERVLARILMGLSAAYHAKGEAGHALEVAQEAEEHLANVKDHPQSFVWTVSNPELYYELATLHLRLHGPERGLETLSKAVEAGWRDASAMERDPELASLHDDERFKAMVEKIRSLPAIVFSRLPEPATVYAGPKWPK
jgi:eukaryotic-like serine/threonine-protein kinase